jgi:hypothetical protein
MRLHTIVATALLSCTLACAGDRTEIKPAATSTSTSYQEPAPAPAGSPTILLNNLSAEGVESAESYTLFVRRGILETGKAFVVLKREQTELLAACSTEECLYKVQQELGSIRYVVSGGLGKLGEKWVARLQLIDPTTAEVIKRVVKMGNGSPEDLLLAAGREIGESLP